MIKADRLFLLVNNVESSQLKNILDFNKLFDDDFVLSEGQEFLVFSSLSNRSSEDLKFSYNLSKDFPLLLSHHGKEYSGYLDIEDYLISNDLILRD